MNPDGFFRVRRRHANGATPPSESAQFLAMPELFATGYMVGLMEWTCMCALELHLEPGEGSLGTRIDVTHVAPSPPEGNGCPSGYTSPS
ncbi:thioesterase family protein [Cystobacter ferrugineus]|uniref:thioesterase family protein n=1 Tax=Cystobacter ferrugineus TaxID=83449 RepID=UPI003CCB7893